jgi:hypothetical protein
MEHRETLRTAAGVLTEREKQYGDAIACFKRISDLSTIVLNKEISTYDVAMILHCTKLGRLQQSRNLNDNYVDGINYLAFASEFINDGRSGMVAMEDDIAAMAKKFAPVNQETEHG